MYPKGYTGDAIPSIDRINKHKKKFSSEHVPHSPGSTLPTKTNALSLACAQPYIVTYQKVISTLLWRVSYVYVLFLASNIKLSAFIPSNNEIFIEDNPITDMWGCNFMFSFDFLYNISTCQQDIDTTVFVKLTLTDHWSFGK